MAFNEKLAERIRQLLGRRTDVSERPMFGGLSFLLNGRMCCGIIDDDLVCTARHPPSRIQTTMTPRRVRN